MVAYSFSFPHHGQYSSYHRLLHYLEPSDAAFDASMPAWLYNRFLNRRGIIQKSWRAYYEGKAWNHAEQHGHRWFHYLYPEHSHFRGKRRKGEDMRMLFSCHLPSANLEAGRLSLLPFMEGLPAADGIILMSPDELEYYAALAPRTRIAFIPHGIDIHWFKPACKRPSVADDMLRVLTVGNMLRDFGKLAAVIRHVHEIKHAKVRFTVLASRANIENLRSLVGESAWDIVDGRWGLDDKALLDLYQDSDLMFLPLLAATANNAVLEAMATGLPMLVSDLPACRAYAADFAIYFSQEENAADLAKRIAEIDPASESMRELARKGRERAVSHLSWESIQRAHKEFTSAIDANQSWTHE